MNVQVDDVDEEVSIKPRIVNTVKASKHKASAGHRAQLSPLYEDEEIENLRSIDRSSKDNIF